MCVVQLRCDICEIATILNEFNQSLERKKHLSSLVYVLKKFDKLPLRKFCLLLYVHYLVGLCNVQCLDQEHSTQNLLWNIIFNFGFKIQPVKRFFLQVERTFLVRRVQQRTENSHQFSFEWTTKHFCRDGLSI